MCTCYHAIFQIRYLSGREPSCCREAKRKRLMVDIRIAILPYNLDIKSLIEADATPQKWQGANLLQVSKN